MGVGRAARPRRQAAAGPALQRFEVSSKQEIQRSTVARVRAIEQVNVDSASGGTDSEGTYLVTGGSGFYPEGDDRSRGLFGGRRRGAL